MLAARHDDDDDDDDASQIIDNVVFVMLRAVYVFKISIFVFVKTFD